MPRKIRQPAGDAPARDVPRKLTVAERERAKEDAWSLSSRGQSLSLIAKTLGIGRDCVRSLLNEAAADRRPVMDPDAMEEAKSASRAIKLAVIESAWQDWREAAKGGQNRTLYLNVILSASRDLDKIDGIAIERRGTVDEHGKLAKTAELIELLKKPLAIEIRDAGDTTEFEKGLE